jgi:hypothetical protein
MRLFGFACGAGTNLTARGLLLAVFATISSLVQMITSDHMRGA